MPVFRSSVALQPSVVFTQPGGFSVTGSGSVWSTFNVGSSLTVGTTAVVTTSLRTPLLIGGTGTTSDLNLQSTTGVGTVGSAVNILTGSNGATTTLHANSTGVSIKSATDAAVPLYINGSVIIGNTQISTANFTVVNNTNTTSSFALSSYNGATPVGGWAFQTTNDGRFVMADALTTFQVMVFHTGATSGLMTLNSTGVGVNVAPSLGLFQIGGTYATTNWLLYMNATQTSTNTTEIGGMYYSPGINPQGASLTTAFGAVAFPRLTGSSIAITNFIGQDIFARTDAGYSGTLTNTIMLRIQAPTFNGSAPANLYGIDIGALTGGTTLTRGIRSQVASGSAKHNLYISGTAQNYLEGNLGIGIAVPLSKLHIEGASGWIIQDEQDANPTTTELDADDSVAFYNKADKFVIAYNNGGTMTYISIPLDGSTTTWTHSTSAP